MAKKAAPVVDDDIEELEDAATEAPEVPAEPESFGVRSLIALVKAKTGKEYTPREVRTLLRKMARNQEGVNRDIVAGNKTRYEWTGSKDPEVLAIVKQIKGGAIEVAKKAALAKLKEDKAARDAANPKPPKPDVAAKTKKTKATAPAAPPVDDDDDDDDDE